MTKKMNELLFFFHLIILVSSLLGALALGKQGLTGLICVLAVLMNLFVLKQITLFNLTVTATDAFAVAVTLGLNLMQEYYGLAAAQKTIWIGFYVSAVTLSLSKIHLWYTPSSIDICHPHYEVLLTAMPRIVIASLVTYLIVMQSDALLYKWLKVKFDNRYLVARNMLSLSISQLMDTLLFSVLGLWGIVPYLSHIIFVSYTIKILTIICISPFVALTKKFVQPGQAA